MVIEIPSWLLLLLIMGCVIGIIAVLYLLFGKSTPSEEEDSSWAKNMDSGERAAHYSHLGEEMRFLKRQQWQTAYYTMLVFAAVIGLFEIKFFGGTAPRIISTVVVVFLMGHQVYVQSSSRKSLIRARKLQTPMSVAAKIPLLKPVDERNKRDLLFTVPILVISLIAGGITIAYVWS